MTSKFTTAVLIASLAMANTAFAQDDDCEEGQERQNDECVPVGVILGGGAAAGVGAGLLGGGLGVGAAIGGLAIVGVAAAAASSGTGGSSAPQTVAAD